MKKVLILSVMLVVALSLPAAAYDVNWTDNFDSYSAGALNSQGGWVSSGINVVNDLARSAPNSVQQPVVGVTTATKNMRSAGWSYNAGYVKAWIYDPASGGGIDTRVGPHSSAGTGVSNMFTANATDSRSAAFWYAQWSWTPVQIDGTAAPTGGGYYFTAVKPAARVSGWGYVIVSWAFDYTAGTGQVQWRINSTTPNLQLNLDSTSGRWAASHDVAGIFLGSAYGAMGTDIVQGHIDDLEFKGNVIPEPTSLLALGTGLIGLAGLIRRKR